MGEAINQLVSVPLTPGYVDKPNQLYLQMQTAISACHSVDDCREIADQAHAIAAYYKQIKDDESVWKFLTVKLRAWRKIGETFLTIDTSDCASMAARIRKVRTNFQADPSIMEMSDTAISDALKLGEVRADFFEREAGRHSAVSSMVWAHRRLIREEWETSPEGLEEQKRRKERLREIEADLNRARAEQAKRQREEKEAQEQERRDLAALQAAREEVGFTMHRRDREHMREVVFVIKAPIHETLRQAAFDRRITMQAILRAGLAMWFVAKGYPVSLDDMDLKRRASSSKAGAMPSKAVSPAKQASTARRVKQAKRKARPQ
jgi:hypothetical protein